MEHITPFKSYMDALNKCIENMAFMRQMAISDGYDAEIIDHEINKLCAKWHNKYDGMSQLQLALHGMGQILQSNHAEDFLDKMFEELGGDD